ncbi:MAG: translation initiation factor eIF2B subunit delta [Amphiamblys sp. WSBS2006]|nr:MAG: translation initiation factor eIF2B subunit delta [Amphiamblys sp. WSBS2006]
MPPKIPLESIPPALYLAVEKNKRRRHTGIHSQLEIIGAVKKTVATHRFPGTKCYGRDLGKFLRPLLAYIEKSGNILPAVENFLSSLQTEIRQLTGPIPEAEGRAAVVNFIDFYVRSKVVLSRQKVIALAAGTIEDGDTLLVIGTDLVSDVLEKASADGKKTKTFAVCSLDDEKEARRFENAVCLGATVSLIRPEAAAHFFTKDTKVFTDCIAVYQNLVAKTISGTLAVTSLAGLYCRPVYLLAETCKLCRLDAAFTFEALNTFTASPQSSLPGDFYDALSGNDVSHIITEFGVFSFPYTPQIIKANPFGNKNNSLQPDKQNGRP